MARMQIRKLVVLVCIFTFGALASACAPKPLTSSQKKDFADFYRAYYAASTLPSDETQNHVRPQGVLELAELSVLPLDEENAVRVRFAKRATRPERDQRIAQRLTDAFARQACTVEHKMEGTLRRDPSKKPDWTLRAEVAGRECPMALKLADRFTLDSWEAKAIHASLKLDYEAKADELKEWSDVSKIQHEMNVDIEGTLPWLEERTEEHTSNQIVSALFKGEGNATSQKFGKGDVAWEVSYKTNERTDGSKNRYISAVKIRIEVKLSEFHGILTIEADDIAEDGTGTAKADINGEALTEEEFREMVSIATRVPNISGRESVN